VADFDDEDVPSLNLKMKKILLRLQQKGPLSGKTSVTDERSIQVRWHCARSDTRRERCPKHQETAKMGGWVRTSLELKQPLRK
jgi:hypothetical protein